MLVGSFRENDDVFKINQTGFLCEPNQRYAYHTLHGSGCVTQPEWNWVELDGTPASYESCVEFCICTDIYLLVSTVCVKCGEVFRISQRI